MKFYLEEIRRSKGISLSELSRRCGISKSDLQYIRLGAIDPRIGTLCKIAKALDVPVARLFSCDDD